MFNRKIERQTLCKLLENMAAADTKIRSVSKPMLTSIEKSRQTFAAKFATGAQPAAVFSMHHEIDMIMGLTKWITESPLKGVAWFFGIMAYSIAIIGVNVLTMVIKVTGQR